MARRVLAAVFTIVILLTSVVSRAAGEPLRLLRAPSLLRPGRAELFAFEAEAAGTATLSLLSETGALIMDVRDGFTVYEGENFAPISGFDAAMEPVAPGNYLLSLRMGEERLETPLVIGPVSPQVTRLALDSLLVTPGSPFKVTVGVNMPGVLAAVLHIADRIHEIYHQNVGAGETVITWDGLLAGTAPPQGSHTLSVLFLDESGFPANQQHIALEIGAAPVSASPQATPQPAARRDEPARTFTVPTREEVPDGDPGKDYWRLPVGVWDEAAIWNVLQQPVTVIDGRDQRDTYKLRAARDDSSSRDNILGEITMLSQGVHVIESYGDGWSLVEGYNSSYGPDNRTRRGYGDTDALLRGYVRTSLLKTITPRGDYGILIDKLKQRMYVFKEGKLFTELVISTGKPTRQQPWNETPTGEYLMVSRVGEFTTGNLVCRMAMRINGGTLIHEVPYILNEETGFWDYSSQEAQLGKKASHGCIRVQRKPNADGINMEWLWNNIRGDTKVIIWDDQPGRYTRYPEDGLKLY
ncbi:MAG TPA: L,D-transpeptidase, partial [Candidatus Limnocylindria bacterium]|nr:L,D-transpeptidase [Candidatus Limnocylindria bacterium]